MDYNLRQIMITAHSVARLSNEATYKEKLSIGLKYAWQVAKGLISGPYMFVKEKVSTGLKQTWKVTKGLLSASNMFRMGLQRIDRGLNRIDSATTLNGYKKDPR